MTFIPYVRFFRTVAGLGTVVFVMDKSADSPPARANCGNCIMASANNHPVLVFIFLSFVQKSEFRFGERDRGLGPIREMSYRCALRSLTPGGRRGCACAAPSLQL
jgi:hypothetical protein